MADEIGRFRGKDLLSINVSAESKRIARIFDGIMEVRLIGPTSASKVLHVLAPDFFMMWDDEIRAKIRLEKPFPRSGKGYAEFMEEMRKRGREVAEQLGEEELRKLSGKKPLTKLLDEYNWLEAHPHFRKRLEKAFRSGQDRTNSASLSRHSGAWQRWCTPTSF